MCTVGDIFTFTLESIAAYTVTAYYSTMAVQCGNMAIKYDYPAVLNRHQELTHSQELTHTKKNSVRV